MSQAINPSSQRAKEARLGKRIGKTGYTICVSVTLASAGVSLFGLITGFPFSLTFLGLSLLALVPALWWKRRLSVLPPKGKTLDDRLSFDVLVRLSPHQEMQPQAIWLALQDHWQAQFFSNHLLVGIDAVTSSLSTDAADFPAALDLATQIADQNQSETIELGFIVAGLMQTSPQFEQLLHKIKAQPSDVMVMADWLGRNLRESRQSRQSFGGIGRDWAFGFTPLLNKFGQNLSLSIAKYGAHFGSLTQSDGVLAVEGAFNNNADAVVLLGEDGIGKTNSVYAFAQRLIEGNTVPSLAYHQLFSLNATDITSQARGEGDLENIMISLVNEAAHAKHIILFFDNSQLFFADGPGTFDASQILLSVVQSRAVPMIFAMSPSDFQRLRTHNQSLASLLTPVTLQEPSQSRVMEVLEDAAVMMENKSKVLIAYEAMREAYSLSGRYNQDQAYPGKAIKLLEQSIAHSEHTIVSAQSVQKAVEQTYGVKVGSVAPTEADALLNLEDDIHKRMINQTYAVSAVSSALRRARAGVTNPKRPIGSFLFLGPTGVGKTELAKAIAATYFKSESSLIRLDMSEYQQPEDVQRLLATGQNETSSLLMRVREQPFAVVLLDEIEKAHPNLLNLLLQLLDEGQLTDSSGKPASFKDCVIIATSNASAQTIRDRVARGESLETFAPELTDELINSGQFKPELLNRFDDIILFRPLTPEELGQVVQLMMGEVNQTLSNQNISVELTPEAVSLIVAKGNDPRLGARPMRRALQKAVEDTVAQKILRNETQPGDKVVLDAPDLTI